MQCPLIEAWASGRAHVFFFISRHHHRRTACDAGHGKQDRMKRRSASILSMGAVALAHGQQHPDTDAGFTVSLAKLQELVERGWKAATLQRECEVNQRTATKVKRKLRRAMQAGPIAHLAGVGRLAGEDHIELGQTFVAKPRGRRYDTFLTMARAMYTAALAHRDVLAPYGASESVLERFGQMLDQFEAAVTLGMNGRTEHKGATLEIDQVARRITQIVKIMDARNLQRFEDDPGALGEWVSARQVHKTPKHGVRAPVEDGAAGTTGIPPAPGTEGPASGVRPAA
jgi:hypothetical protein